MSRLLGWFVERSPLSLLTTRIRYKLLAGLLAVSLIPLLGLGVASYFATQRALVDEAASKLQAVGRIKATQLETLFSQARNQLRSFAETRRLLQPCGTLARVSRTGGRTGRCGVGVAAGRTPGMVREGFRGRPQRSGG